LLEDLRLLVLKVLFGKEEISVEVELPAAASQEHRCWAVSGELSHNDV